jgi:hypothetical protein
MFFDAGIQPFDLVVHLATALIPFVTWARKWLRAFPPSSSPPPPSSSKVAVYLLPDWPRGADGS